jgi:hypothetical protein
MAPKRVLKKVEGTAENTGIEGDVVADTTPHSIDSIKFWRQIFENLDYEIKNFLHDSENKLWDIAESELHKIAARVTLQKAIIYSASEETSKTTKISATEQIRGDIMLKLWETNIVESKRIVKEIIDDYEEVFDLLDKRSLNIGKGNCTGLLGQINIVRHQLNFRENLSEIQIEISQLREMDVTLINKLLVEPNLKLQSIKFVYKGAEDHLSKIQRKVYLFKEKDLP